MNLAHKLHNFGDFEKASLSLIDTQDVDPVYPFLKAFIQMKKYDPELTIFIYVYFYSLESMILFMKELQNKKYIEEIFEGIKKYGNERGRNPNVRKKKNFVLAFTKWIDDVVPKLKNENPTFEEARELFRSLPYFGSWASYKLCELFSEVLGYKNVKITTLGIEKENPNKNVGPIFGLRYLYGLISGKNKTYNTLVERKKIRKEWETLGQALSKLWKCPIAQVESCLCKVPKILSKGTYVIGHDINEFLDLNDGIILSSKEFWKIMTLCHFDRKFLQSKFTKKEKRAYVDKKTLLFSE